MITSSQPYKKRVDARAHVPHPRSYPHSSPCPSARHGPQLPSILIPVVTAKSYLFIYLSVFLWLFRVCVLSIRLSRARESRFSRSFSPPFLLPPSILLYHSSQCIPILATPHCNPPRPFSDTRPPFLFVPHFFGPLHAHIPHIPSHRYPSHSMMRIFGPTSVISHFLVSLGF